MIGDQAGPTEYGVEGVEFFSLERQLTLPFLLARELPRGHYARKNIGYLVAMGEMATCIYETDDDNLPAGSWRRRSLVTEAVPITRRGWFNPLSVFSDALVWPRGLPLGEVAGASLPIELGRDSTVCAPVQQGLADESPDVDAVWRLAWGQPVRLSRGPSLALDEGVWTAFNSQSTWWWPPAYPLMYLPATCSFRMTDILRGYVAQRCLWASGDRVVIHGPEVIQVRNEHDLASDLRLELPGQLAGPEAVRRLQDLELAEGERAVETNMERCYEVLVEAGLVRPSELRLLALWHAAVGEALARDGATAP